MDDALGRVVKGKGMGSNLLSPLLIDSKPLHLMNHRSLADAALETEPVLQQTLAQHPIHNQTLAQGPLAKS